jgi:hypothetical protein
MAVSQPKVRNTRAVLILGPQVDAMRFLARTRKVRRALGVLGISMALPFFVWTPLGMVEGIPSIVETYGFEGLRIPTSITIGGLLLAALGFFEK